MAQPPGIDPGLRQAKALAFLADEICRRHTHLIEDDLAWLVVHHEIVGGRHLHPRCIHVDEQGGYAAAALLFRIGDCEYLGEVGLVSEIALIVARPRADRDLSMLLFAVAVGSLLSGGYLLYLGLGPGTWWPPDMIYGSIVACALVSALISYVIFPSSDALRAALVLWPAQAQDSSRTAPEVTVERVEHALKVLHSTRDLAESPLVGLHSVPSPTAAWLCCREAVTAPSSRPRRSGGPS